MDQPGRAAAAYVIDDDRAVLKLLSEDLLGAFPRHRAGIEHVAAARLADLGHAGDAGDVLKLVHRHGVVDHGGDAEGPCDRIREHAGEVGDVNVDLGRVEIVDHLLIDDERAARHGGQQAAARHDAVEAPLIDTLSFKRFVDMRHAVIELVHDPGKLLDLVQRVADRLGHDLLVVVENGDLGGGGTGIDNKNSAHIAPSSNNKRFSVPNG